MSIASSDLTLGVAHNARSNADQLGTSMGRNGNPPPWVCLVNKGARTAGRSTGEGTAPHTDALATIEAEIRHGSMHDALRHTAVTIGAEQLGLSPDEVMRRLRQRSSSQWGND